MVWPPADGRAQVPQGLIQRLPVGHLGQGVGVARFRPGQALAHQLAGLLHVVGPQEPRHGYPPNQSAHNQQPQHRGR